MAFDTVKRTLLYESVVSLIKEMIKREELKPGDRLPTERELVNRLSISRGTLREAFRVLELEGLIETRPGGGRHVRSTQLFSDRDDIIASLEKAAIWDLLEVREVLEVKIVELACQRATHQDLDEIGSALERHGAHPAAVGEALSSDEDFHLSIARASHNLVFFNIMKLHLDMLRRTRERTATLPGRPEEMLEEHGALYAAIRARNGPEATAALHRHLQAIRKRLTQSVVAPL